MFLKKNILSGIVGVVLVLNISGCTQKKPSIRLGQFTMASSSNVRNLNYTIADKTKTETIGEDCHRIGLKGNDARLQRAMDDAIKKGQRDGIDGDILVNVRIDQESIMRNTGFLGSPEEYNCMVVRGDLVKIK